MEFYAREGNDHDAWDMDDEHDIPDIEYIGEEYDAYADSGTLPSSRESVDGADAHQMYKTINRQLRAALIRIAESSGDPTDRAQYENIEGYIACGASQFVFELPGGEAVMKVPVAVCDQYEVLIPGEEGWAIDWEREDRVQRQYVEALERAKGTPGLEQIIDHVDIGQSGEGAIICRKAPGMTLKDRPLEEIDEIPKEHFRGLLRSLEALKRLGLLFDDLGARGNVLYDPEAGFTLIDYSLGRSADPPYISAASVLGFARNVLYQRDGGPLPRSAAAFYESCREVFGEEMATQLRQQWLEQGYTLPKGI